MERILRASEIVGLRVSVAGGLQFPAKKIYKNEINRS
jgi:hypothetical protein